MDSFTVKDVSPLYESQILDMYYMDPSVCDLFTLTLEPKVTVDESENISDESEDTDDE